MMAEAGLSSSGLTRENIVYDKDGNAYIPATQRPDGTWRKAIKVKPGYIPQEEVPVYQSKGKTVAQSAPKVLPSTNYLESFEREVAVEQKPLTKAQKKNLRKKQKRKEQKASQVAFVVEEVTSAIDKVCIQDSKEPRVQSTELDISETTLTAIDDGVKDEGMQQKDNLKKVRTLRKKLKQIEDLENRIASGEIIKPDLDQLNKIAKKEEFKTELEVLEACK